MKILIVLTSCGQVPNSDRKTGTWLEEFAAPYYAFKDAGATVVIASVSGGAAPIDPMSEETTAQSDATRRFAADDDAKNALSKTIALPAINAGDHDAVFYSGGLGPVFDLTNNQISIALIGAMHDTNKPTAAVCHGVAALLHVQTNVGAPLVLGRKVTGFSNDEERAAHGVGIVPFLIEDQLRQIGGDFSSGPEWAPDVVADHKLITGQNPASSLPAAMKLLELMNRG